MDKSVPKYSCKLATGFKIDLIDWPKNDSANHDTDFRKITITFDTVPPSEDEIKDCGDYVKKEKSQLDISTSDDFTKLAEAISKKKDTETLTSIIDLDQDHIDQTQVNIGDEDIISCMIYMENLELDIVQVTKEADLVDCWSLKDDVLKKVVDEIYKLNSKFALGVIA